MHVIIICFSNSKCSENEAFLPGETGIQGQGVTGMISAFLTARVEDFGRKASQWPLSQVLPDMGYWVFTAMGVGETGSSPVLFTKDRACDRYTIEARAAIGSFWTSHLPSPRFSFLIYKVKNKKWNAENKSSLWTVKWLSSTLQWNFPHDCILRWHPINHVCGFSNDPGNLWMLTQR